MPTTFTVLSTLDDGSNGTLRWAIDQANSTTGADTIDFDPSVIVAAQTIFLTGGELTLSDSATTTINGPGAGLLSISGNNASRVFVIYPGSDALAELTVTGGSSTNG